MKKTDIMTPAGFVLGAALIGYGIVSGGPFSIFIDIPSIFICVGGSLSALFITYTMDEIKENDYNLNIPRYVDTFEEEEEIDLDAVQVDLEKIDEEDKKVTEELNKYLRELGLKELK